MRGQEAKPKPVPDWAKPAVRYLVDEGVIDRAKFDAAAPMSRSQYATAMQKLFGGGFKTAKGNVTAGQVGASLVRALERDTTAQHLETATAPDGWRPATGRWFGSEIVARELGLRYNHPSPDDDGEFSADEPMPQADVAYALWKAKTAPATWSADVLNGFTFGSYSEKRKAVVEFALSLVGTPYVWGGEWPRVTPSGYPYGAQSHGGFDCSGFAWYVLKESSKSWSPTARPYQGWSFPERASAEMARGTEERLGFRKLRPGDVIFFAPEGRNSKASSVYHAGIYLGRGWMVHSSGSRAGISLGQVGPGSWWHDQIAWGRRIINS